jgi:Cys-tRNA(Pro)/Cys-tRNA(Cys) deacylase
MMSVVNNVTRFLDSRKVNYEMVQLPPEKLSAVDVAHLLDVDPDSVFKTIVVTRNKTAGSGLGKKPLLVLVPGSATVDLKLLATLIGEKKVYLPTEHEAEQLTGLQAGGISPLALLHKGFKVVIDSSAKNFSKIHISGGQRGLNILIPIDALVKLVNAQVRQVCHPLD